MMRQVAMAIVVATTAASAASAQAATSSREPEITASGRGEVKLPPSYAILTVNIATRAIVAVEAASQNARRVPDVMNGLRSAGLADKDISTSGYRLEQNYEYPRNAEPKPSGFTATTTIRAEVRPLENLGKAIDAAISGGATGVSGIQFLASNTEEARRSAMAEAVRQARTEAEVIARAAGGSLGRLIALNSGGVSQPNPRDMNYALLTSSMAPPLPTNIVPGELNITAMVFGRWEFIPGASR
ncbi:MAG TPA: SIMPL domain-containing protein [Gemmatimonadaceae bacterium]|nr:SIMPL domain-containing protein [Gemmatimonadaceae bacterium]